jgi:hypothetical protein
MVTFTVCRMNSVMMASSSHHEGSGDVVYYLYVGEREGYRQSEGAVGGSGLGRALYLTVV